MRKKRITFRGLLDILVYVSIVFLLQHLYRNDLIFIPELQKPIYLAFSVVLLLMGYLCDAKAWQLLLIDKLPGITFRHAFESTGKFIFSKYIPGKLWVIVGRGGYIASRYNHSFVGTTFLSFFHQFIVILSGLLLGVGILYKIDVNWFLTIALLSVLMLVGILTNLTFCISLINKLLSWILKDKVTLPQIAPVRILSVIVFSISGWLLWSFAFYLLILSSFPFESLPLTMGLIFPISAVFGIIVIIAPGGLGFREGLLALGLVAFGISAIEAASISILSRLWFISGEIFYFSAATISGKTDKQLES